MTQSQEAQGRYTAKIAEARAAIKDGTTPEARTKYDAIMVEAEAIAGDVRRFKQLEEAETEQRRAEQLAEETRKAGRPGLPQLGENGSENEERSEDPKEKEKRSRELRKAFTSFSRTGDSAQLRALGSAVGTNGGYTIETQTLPELEEALLSFGGVIPFLGDFTTSTGVQINLPTVNDTNNMGIEIGENVATTEQDMPFGSVASTVGLFSTQAVLVPRTLLRDSAVDVAAYVAKALGVRRARRLSYAAINGTQTNGSFDSLVNVATVGATSAGPTAIGLPDATNLFGAVDPGYAVDGDWAMNRNTQLYLSTLRNNLGTPIFPLDSTGFLTTIFGRPIRVDLNMPNIAAGSKSILFGNLKKYYYRPVGTMEIQRLEERYAEFNQVGFLGFYSAGGRLVDAGTHPIQALQQHS